MFLLNKKQKKKIK